MACWEDEVVEWMEERPRSTGYSAQKAHANFRSLRVGNRSTLVDNPLQSSNQCR